MIRTPIDLDDLRRLHAQRLTVREIARQLGTCDHVVRDRCREEGLPTGRRWWLDADEIARLYDEGKSVKELAGIFGVDRTTIHDRLCRTGVHIRGHSEAAFLKASQTPPEVRSRNALAAHAAVRGRRHSFEEKCQRAATREARQLGISRIERIAADLLHSKGEVVLPQRAVGPYNIDVAIDGARVAVEIYGGNWHASGSHARRFRERTDYLIDAGWLPVYIWVTRDYPLELGAIEYVVALAEKVRRGEPVWRQEHMIRGDGQPSTRGYCELNNIPVVHGPQPRNDTTGRFAPRIR